MYLPRVYQHGVAARMRAPMRSLINMVPGRPPDVGYATSLDPETSYKSLTSSLVQLGRLRKWYNCRSMKLGIL